MSEAGASAAPDSAGASSLAPAENTGSTTPVLLDSAALEAEAEVAEKAA